MIEVRFFQGGGLISRLNIEIHARIADPSVYTFVVVVAPTQILRHWVHALADTRVFLCTPYSFQSLDLTTMRRSREKTLVLVDECYPEQLKAVYNTVREVGSIVEVITLVEPQREVIRMDYRPLTDLQKITHANIPTLRDFNFKKSAISRGIAESA